MKPPFLLFVVGTFLMISVSSAASVSRDQITFSSWCYAVNSGANFEKWDFRADGSVRIQVLRINGVGTDRTFIGNWNLNDKYLSISTPGFGSKDLEIVNLKGDHLEFSNGTRAYSCF